jgi:hypothetical protein
MYEQSRDKTPSERKNTKFRECSRSCTASKDHQRATLTRNTVSFFQKEPILLMFLAHKFVNITYRTPTECDLPNCQEGQLWGIVRAPQAVACQKCSQKYHACCVQPNSPAYMRLPPCRGVVAEEMLVLAPEIRDQNEWLRCLLKKIEKTTQGNTNNQPVSLA